MAGPAAGVSRRLAAAGFVRHTGGVAGFIAAGAGAGGVTVQHVDRYGSPLPPGPDLQAYGRFLAKLGYSVWVENDSHLLVGPRSEAL